MKQIVIDYAPGGSRVALIEDRRLAEFYMEETAVSERAGNIYKGRVVNVLPGMQAAFVDIGQERNAFLYIDDLLPAHLEKQPPVKPSIRELVNEGSELIVQVKKDAIGTKGARVTTHCTIPGRWIVLLPDADYAAVSRKIAVESEKSRLKALGEQLRLPGEGVILRTVAEAEPEEALAADLEQLRDVWAAIAQRAQTAAAPTLLYRDLDMIPRLVRDLFTNEADEIVVNDEGLQRELAEMLRDASPELAGRVVRYDGGKPIFHAYGIAEELDKSFRRKIWLDCGGYLMIDHTEALTVIDVNTGKNTGEANLEQTVFETNAEAARLIPRLLRLRDIGGIVVVDFIDMTEEAHRRQIADELGDGARRDRTKTVVVGWTRLGLVELTRKKVRHSLDETLFDTCDRCAGRGKIPSARYPHFSP